ncbi:MAG: ABC transporter ATP-binding protein [Pseudomonadota bacterium]
MTKLQASNISIDIGQDCLVSDASFELNPRELTVLLGPNGAGKTSLLRGSLGLQALSNGTSTLSGVPLSNLSPTERARQVAYLPQIRPLAWPNRVQDVVALGRFSHGAAIGRLSPKDSDAVDRALSDCDLLYLRDRDTQTLSGGELARVHCARAFATKAPLLIADEPTAALDPRHQFRILDLIKAYVDKGGGALLVLHDIELAARYATRLIWMKQGRIVTNGSVAETLTADRLANVYGVAAQVDGQKVIMDGAL